MSGWRDLVPEKVAKNLKPGSVWRCGDHDVEVLSIDIHGMVTTEDDEGSALKLVATSFVNAELVFAADDTEEQDEADRSQE